MFVIHLDQTAGFEQWRPFARLLLKNKVYPDDVNWQTDANDDLFSNGSSIFYIEDLEESLKARVAQSEVAEKINKDNVVPRDFIAMAQWVAAHSAVDRFDLLYRLLFRIANGERTLLNNAADPLVKRSQVLSKQVTRDYHKMKAFLRFKEVRLRDIEPVSTEQDMAGYESFQKSGDNKKSSDNTQTLVPGIDKSKGGADIVFLAWFEPTHYILELTASFFIHRFYGMNWSIVTPYRSMHWYNRQLRFSEGGDRSAVPESDALDQAWQLYYASIFNPARLKVKAMCSEMPKKYWHNLPEATLIKPMIATATHRMENMIESESTSVGNISKSARFDREQWLNNKNGASRLK